MQERWNCIIVQVSRQVEQTKSDSSFYSTHKRTPFFPSTSGNSTLPTLPEPI